MMSGLELLQIGSVDCGTIDMRIEVPRLEVAGSKVQIFVRSVPLITQSAFTLVLFTLKVGQYEYSTRQSFPSFASVSRRIVVPNVGSTSVPPAAGSAGNEGSG